MSESTPRLRMAEDDGTIVIQVVGPATMDAAYAIRRHVEHREQSPSLPRIQLDLRHCSYMDSTFQGMLLVLSGVNRHGPPRSLEVVSPSAQCRKLLQDNKLDRILSIVDREEPAEGVWQEHAIAPQRTESGFQETVVTAHERIVECDTPLAERYREVVKQFRAPRSQP